MDMKDKCWEVQPKKSVNGILFGTERKRVRELIGGKYTEFKKTDSSSNTTDAYEDFHIYYDEDDLLEAVEIFGNISVTINGNVVFPGEIQNAKTVIQDLEFDNECYISKTESIGIYAPDDSMESILVAKEGYYSALQN